ncbi:unnamed protein product, partial [Polarella glacialis]
LLLVYCPLGYWNWGGGWMFQIGAWDFAGGMIVHESAGFAALASLWVLGPREKQNTNPHSIPMVVIGTSILWFGWFGFNGGSALAIDSPAVAMVTWMALDWLFMGKPTIMGACAGAVTGLVVITPSAGFVQPGFAMVAGVMGGVVCWTMTYIIKNKTNLDDTCDTVGVHGTGGFLGTILVGVLSDPECCLNAETAPEWCANPGTVIRSWNQFKIQTLCAVVSAVYSIIVTYCILKTILTFWQKPLVTDKQQATARDEYAFGEEAY